MSWTPPIVNVGDIVTCSTNPEWGQGTILSVTFLGDLPLPDGEIITYQKNTVGQRASVRFADGRTRTILTPLNPLNRFQ